MKNCTLYLIKIFVLFFILVSCSDDEKECVSNNLTYVTSVNSPTNGVVNEVINIEVNFPVSSGCGGFGKFIETENGNNKIIQVEAKYIGCICTQNAPIITVNYEFIAQNTGNYILNFKSSETEFITINLTIN